MKRTMIIGATDNPERYAFKAAHMLKKFGHEIVPMGVKKGELAGEPILNEKLPVEGIDTVTLYVGAPRQSEYYSYIFSLKPKRIIFNPGTENDELYQLAEERGIEPVEACTLVLLSTGQY